MRYRARLILTAFFLVLLTASAAQPWFDRTHIAIAKAAGYSSWYNAAGADMVKTKTRAREEKNHYFNNYENAPVSAEMVLGQVERYDSPADEEGHLYGAILAAIHEYRAQKAAGKYGEYHMAFAAHYIGDLSQPLHNMLYDQFNREHHPANDAVVDEGIFDKISAIQAHMYEITVRREHFDEDAAREIARIANSARVLGLKLRAENRDLTRDEAFVQLGHSASLLKAVLTAVSGSPPKVP